MLVECRYTSTKRFVTIECVNSSCEKIHHFDVDTYYMDEEKEQGKDEK